MKGLNKILQGVLKYKKTIRKDILKLLEKVYDNPQPTALFFTCMDSRILPSEFTQSSVGDMFVVRNSGNMIPRAKIYGSLGQETSVNTEPAALELAVSRGKINHVIVCGHSDCKAINTLYNLHIGKNKFNNKSPMDCWLIRNGYFSLKQLEFRECNGGDIPLKFDCENDKFSFNAFIDKDDTLDVEDRLSQINTLQQLLNIGSHEFMNDYISSNKVFIHAMWFDIYTGNMHMFSREDKCFKIINESNTNEFINFIEKEMKKVKKCNHRYIQNCC
uniref:Carbonic anhydrase n=1 Tax=Parastrongyloides trichosuri TaxID=131310 RepID=A0A0N4ZFD7_PARTI